MKIACIDDQKEEGIDLLNLVQNQFRLFDIPISEEAYFPSSTEFFESWHPGLYSLIFVDIFLNEEQGISIAKTIRKNDSKVIIVFCSSSNEFACESYEAQANYYLVKPVTTNTLNMMINHLKLTKKQEDLIELPNNQSISASSLIYSDYHNHLITLYFKNKLVDKIWLSQNEFAKLLDPFPYFLAVTPGTIINLKEVVEFKDDCFHLSNGTLIPISKRKKKQLMAQYKNFLFSSLRRS